jgi:hypothetical protein
MHMTSLHTLEPGISMENRTGQLVHIMEVPLSLVYDKFSAHARVMGLSNKHVQQGGTAFDLYRDLRMWLKVALRVDGAVQTVAKQIRADLGRSHCVAVRRAYNDGSITPLDPATRTVFEQHWYAIPVSHWALMNSMCDQALHLRALEGEQVQTPYLKLAERVLATMGVRSPAAAAQQLLGCSTADELTAVDTMYHFESTL